MVCGLSPFPPQTPKNQNGGKIVVEIPPQNIAIILSYAN